MYIYIYIFMVQYAYIYVCMHVLHNALFECVIRFLFFRSYMIPLVCHPTTDASASHRLMLEATKPDGLTIGGGGNSSLYAPGNSFFNPDASPRMLSESTKPDEL